MNDNVAKVVTPGLANITALVQKATVGTSALDGGGKKVPAQGIVPSGIQSAGTSVKQEKCACSKAEGAACDCDDAETVEKVFIADIVKAKDDKQIVVGVVLQPETTDAQGDIYSAAVIEQAAHNYMIGMALGKSKVGYQHKDFKEWQKRFLVVESYITTSDCAIGDRTVKAGSWIMSVKVLDAAVWKQIKAGTIKGFSIGGKAKVKKLKPDNVVATSVA